MADAKVLADLVDFARIEVDSGDLEPWAELLRRMEFPTVEERLWAIKLYNAYDSLGSAMNVARQWPSPQAWALAHDRDKVAAFPCTNERRNLRAGKVVRHLESYQAHVGDAQDRWLWQGFRTVHPAAAFDAMQPWLRRIWGTGRQSAFEWAEFLAKAAGYPLVAGHAWLWESEGPRRSLQRLYGNPNPTAVWLDARADETKQMMADAGVDLPWEDFETVICDFNVMRDGRYYPGRHLAALREEIDEVDEPLRADLLEVFWDMLPAGWRDIAPGIDKTLLPVYRDTGRLALPVSHA